MDEEVVIAKYGLTSLSIVFDSVENSVGNKMPLSDVRFCKKYHNIIPCIMVALEVPQRDSIL